MDVNLLSDELKTVMKDLVKAEFEKQLSEKDALIAQLQDEVAYLNQQIEWFRKSVSVLKVRKRSILIRLKNLFLAKNQKITIC